MCNSRIVGKWRVVYSQRGANINVDLEDAITTSSSSIHLEENERRTSMLNGCLGSLPKGEEVNFPRTSPKPSNRVSTCHVFPRISYLDLPWWRWHIVRRMVNTQTRRLDLPLVMRLLSLLLLLLIFRHALCVDMPTYSLIRLRVSPTTRGPNHISRSRKAYYSPLTFFRLCCCWKKEQNFRLASLKNFFNSMALYDVTCVSSRIQARRALILWLDEALQK